MVVSLGGMPGSGVGTSASLVGVGPGVFVLGLSLRGSVGTAAGDVSLLEPPTDGLRGKLAPNTVVEVESVAELLNSVVSLLTVAKAGLLEVSAAGTEPPAWVRLSEIPLDEDERILDSVPMEVKILVAGKMLFDVVIVSLGDIIVPGDLPADVLGELLMLADGDR